MGRFSMKKKTDNKIKVDGSSLLNDQGDPTIGTLNGIENGTVMDKKKPSQTNSSMVSKVWKAIPSIRKKKANVQVY